MPTLLSSQELQDDLAFVSEQLRQHSDPYDTVRYMWLQRYEEIERQLKELAGSLVTHAEVALLFEGSPVRGSEDIKLAFATKMLDQYQAFVGTIAAEKGGGRRGGQRSASKIIYVTAVYPRHAPRLCWLYAPGA